MEKRVTDIQDLIRYDLTEDRISELGARFSSVTFGSPEDYETGRKAIATIRGLRGEVEKTRKSLKASSLDFCRKVDSVARFLTEKLEAIENPLLEKKKAVDDEEERLKREKERADIIALEAENTRKREEAEAVAKVEREADEKRIAEAAAKLAADQARLDEANKAIAEAQRVERERLAEEKRQLDAKQAALDAHQAEIDRQAKEAEQAEKARLKREEAERQAVADAEAARVEAARLEAMKPEIERVQGFALNVRAFAETLPQFESVECRKAIGWASGVLTKIATGLERFNGKVGP